MRATTRFGFLVLRNSLKFGYAHRPSIYWTAGNPSRGAVAQPVSCKIIWRDLQRSAHQVIALEHVDVKFRLRFHLIPRIYPRISWKTGQTCSGSECVVWLGRDLLDIMNHWASCGWKRLSCFKMFLGDMSDCPFWSVHFFWGNSINHKKGSATPSTSNLKLECGRARIDKSMQKVLCRRMKHLQPRMKHDHYPIRYSSLEHIVLLSSMQSHVSDWTQFLWCHWPSPLQRPEGLLLPWVLNLSRQTMLQSMRATTFNHADVFFFSEDQHACISGKYTTNDLYWTAHELFNLL